MYRFLGALAVLSWCYGAPASTLVDSKMDGGTEVPVSSRPYHLAVLYLESYHCNAVIIGRNWALTSAFCASPPGSVTGNEVVPEYFHLRSGSDRYETGGALHTVERITIHEDYVAGNTSTPDFDIALMRVATPFEFDDVTKPCDLWQFFPPAESTFIVSSWNTKTNQGIVQSQVQVIDQRDCISAYASVSGSIITLNMICAEQLEDDAGPCNENDFGSPLTADDKLIGFVSNPTCFTNRLPTVYTNSVYLRLWIFLHSGIN